MQNIFFSTRRRRATTMTVALAGLLQMLPLPATATGDLMVHEPWSRPLPPTARNGAAYMVIHNHGNEPDRLVGGTTDIAETVEVHTHIMQDDLMKMVRLVDGAEIPAGEKVVFKPHDLHVMLMGLTRPLVAGEQYQLTLTFERGGDQEVTVVVEDRGMGDMSAGGHDHSGHGGS